jgi:hypothetical protein
VQRTTSNEREANRISNEHHPKTVVTIGLVKAAVTIDPVKVAPSIPVADTTDLVVKVGPVIWIARLRTGRAAIFPASASKISNAAAVVEILVVIVLAVEDLVAVIASAVAAGLAEVALAEVADLAEVALAGSVGAAGGAGNN